MTKPQVVTGSCLCQAVRFEVRGPLRDVIYCHCTQCRKSSGHFTAATACAADDLVLLRDDGLAWYASSAHARRGFCATCGASLFWQPLDGSHVSIMAGALDGSPGLTAREHIFTAFAGEYYSLDDGLPSNETDNTT